MIIVFILLAAFKSQPRCLSLHIVNIIMHCLHESIHLDHLLQQVVNVTDHDVVHIKPFTRSWLAYYQVRSCLPICSARPGNRAMALCT